MTNKAEGTHVFISYAGRDQENARELVRSLGSAGVETWLDKRDLQPGEDWELQLEDQLRRARAVVVLLTPESLKSPWTFFEVGAAVADGKAIIPVLLKGVEPEEVPPLLKNYEWVRGSTPSEIGHLIAEAVKETLEDPSGHHWTNVGVPKGRSMADEEQLAVLRQGSAAWNAWRKRNPDTLVDLSEANLVGADLAGANLGVASITGADILREGANLTKANLREANLAGANLRGAKLLSANLQAAVLSEANLVQANLNDAILQKANLTGAKLFRAALGQAYLTKADLTGADLTMAKLVMSSLGEARLAGANLTGAYLTGAHLTSTNLRKANLTSAYLINADLFRADLTGANLNEANLTGARLVETDFTGADLTGCRVHGISAWNVKLEGAKQENLIITPPDEPEITVDNLEVAQFVYLLLHNEKIRAIIDTIGKKGVLLLGRFTGGRIALLERLREELRKRGWVPMVFNFDKPETKDFTETVRLLAGMSHFVIADITNPRSTPLELQATVPECMVPFVPILEKGEEPFAMFQDLWVKYREWVFEPIQYSSVDSLMRGLDEAILGPALARSAELMVRKAERYRIRDIEDITAGAAPEGPKAS